jgi:outer membrane protein assembly factor BamB
MSVDGPWGPRTYQYGPATSSIWCTPSYDAESGTIFFGTDVNTAPRQPTKDDPNLHTPDSCAIRAIDVRTGKLKWNTQINPGDVWDNSMRGYDPSTGQYKDQSVGDTPKIVSVSIDGTMTKCVAAGCKNGGFYLLKADDGRIIRNTPVYKGPPTNPPSPTPDPRTLAMPGIIGGLQSGCATDGKAFFTNGVDAHQLGSMDRPDQSTVPPSGGRVTSISLDLLSERWRHERPKLDSIGGPKVVYKNVGDPVASGIALANGVAFFTTVASGKLIALDATSGTLLKEIPLGPVWCGPSVSRGRVYVGGGNTLFNNVDEECFFPKKMTGEVHCFGLPDK